MPSDRIAPDSAASTAHGTVALIGMGCGSRGGITAEADAALRTAGLIIGSGRLIEPLIEEGLPCTEAVKTQDVLAALEDARAAGTERCCVVLSGDVSLHSGAQSLLGPLQDAGFDIEIYPGISSMQYFAARLGTPWQDWLICSAHGVASDPVAAVCQGRPVFYLTGSADDPARLCRQLVDAGLGDVAITVGEDLSYPSERITTITAAEAAGRTFSALNVLLIEPSERPDRRTPGIPDDAFIRGETPMTKQEVRAVALAKLAVAPDDVCWDVGAGTGSVAVELALQACSVWAIERDPAAAELIRQNRARFCAWDLRIICGSAPEALVGLPAPDAVYIGGTGGRIAEIIDAVWSANVAARICVSAVTLETLTRTLAALEAYPCTYEVTQLAVTRTRSVADLHMLAAQNPVFLITASCKTDGTPR